MTRFDVKPDSKHVANCHDYVIVLAKSKHSDRFIYVIKDRPAFQVNRLNLPGGKIKADEEPIDAAVRELYEETGHSPIGEIRNMGVITGGDEENTFCVHCILINIDDNLEILPGEKETETFRYGYWGTIRDDPRLLPNLRIIIPLMLAGVGRFTLVDQNDSPDNKPYRAELILQ